MNVITFANPKGGSGKTTAAMLLVEQIAASGGRAAVLDLDPNASIAGWAKQRRDAGIETPFKVHTRPRTDETVALIDSLQASCDWLVIDLEGTRDQIATFALSRTDLAVVPLDGSPMEARQAAVAAQLIEQTAAMIRRPIPYTLLFTRTNAAFQTADERDVRQEMEAAGVPVLPVRITRRAPYTRIFREGMLLGELADAAAREAKSMSAQAKTEKQMGSALENARVYAQALVDEFAKRRAA